MHRHLYRHLLWASLLALGTTTGCDDGDGGSTIDSGVRDMDGPGGAGGAPMGGEGGGGAGGVPMGGTGGMPMGGDGGEGGMPMGGMGGMPMGGMGGEGGMPMGGMGGEGGMPMGGMGGEGGGIEEGDIDCGPVDPPAEGTCEVTPGNGTLVITGTLLGPQGLITGGSMTVTPGGIIDCVGCDCADDAATQINCGDAVVSPGLINAHDHITFTQNSPGMWGEERYDHRHDWRRGIRGHTRIRSAGQASSAEVSWGELRQLITGTTSLVGSGGADGLLRNLDRNQEGLMQGDVQLDTFPFGDTGGELRNGNCDYPDLPDRDVLMDDAWSPHVAEGIDNEARNEFLCLSSMDGVDVTGSNGAFIHGVGLTAVDGAIVADRQTAVIWSPRSNISLYGHTAPVTMLETQGVLLGLGTDWTPSGSINMQRELACADRLNRDHYNGFFSDRDLWLMATGNNAQALAVADGVGSLQVGLAADIAVYAPADGNAYRAVINATAADTVLVLRSGDPLYGDAGLVEAIPGGAGCEEIPLCDTQKTVCLQGEIGQGFNALRAANQGSYDLTFCGVPPDEPTCIPSRPNEFDGEITPDDNDGDGVPNDEDNCPDIFNPARPVDGMGQADHDRDGLGDVCDVCPIDADTDECSVPDPNDRDADGVPEDEDNCPGLANPDQADADEDGKGDLCDPCPVADPAGTACPGTIQQIKTNDALIDSQVQVDGVVTAIDANGNFFIQMPDDAVEDGPAFSGIFVFAGNATVDPVPEVERGQSVRVTAQFGDFFGQRQLSRVAGIEVLGDGALPTIALVESAQIGTGGELAAAHEGTLVRVADVEVTAQNPEAGPGDRDPTNSIVVDDVLRINDLFYAFDPLPAVGVSLPSVAGVLRFANGDSKLEPRDANDVEQGPPALLDLGPADGIVRVGETRAPTTPQGELILRLTAPAPEGGLMVALSFEPEGIANGMAVMVPAGELRAPVMLTGVAEGATTVTASLEGSEDVQAGVQVIAADAGPTTLSWNAERIEVLPGADVELVLTADVPGPFDFGLFIFNDQLQPAGFMPNAFTTALPVQAPEAEGEYQVRAVAADLEAIVTIVVSAQPAGADLVINEVDYDQPGADGAEFAEIFNPTGVAIPLAGVVFEAVNGSNGQVYGSYELSDAGAELPAGGYLVIGNAAVIGGLPDGTLSIVLPGNGLQNGGPDGVRLVRGGEFLDGLAYEGAMDGVSEGNAPEAADMGEGSLSRCANGADTDDNAADFMLTMMSTPGAENACP